MRRPPAPARRAFTLMELSVVVALMGLVGTTMVSVLTLATRAFPNGEDASLGTLQVERALDLFAAEVSEAIEIVECKPTAIEFLVPDRDKDALPETIRYEWSDLKGDPFTRSINASTPMILLNSIEDLAFTADEVEVSVTLPTIYTTSAEYILATYKGAGSNDYAITSTAWHGQYVLPTFPVDTVRWDVTGVRVMVKRSVGTGSEFAVELRQPKADKSPSSTILATQTIPKSSLGASNAWLAVPLAASSLAPGGGLCLVLTSAQANSVATSRWQNGGVSQGSEALVRSTDGGNAWSIQPTSAMVYEVSGTHTTAFTPAGSRTHAMRINAEITRAGVTLRRRCILANRPEIGGGP